MKQYQIRPATLENVKLILEWTHAEGWGLGVSDAVPFHVADPTGFFMGFLDGEPISCVAAFRYSDQFGFMGLYIVKPEYRGKGYGLPIWQHGMGYLKGCNMGLDAVLAQQENYQRSGFSFAYHHLHCSGPSSLISPSIQNIVSLKQLPFSSIVEFQKSYFPVSRAGFLSAWLNMPDTFGVAAVENGSISGMGVIRKCFGGYTVGPLFSRDAFTAEQLYLDLCRQIPSDSTVFLDIPEPNGQAVQLMEKLNLKPIFKVARMYKGIAPQLDLSGVYGVTSLTVG